METAFVVCVFALLWAVIEDAGEDIWGRRKK